MSATATPSTSVLYTGNATTAADRILTYLGNNRPAAFSNTEIANALQLPQDSVRRVINELRSTGRVFASVISGRQWTVGY